MSTAIVQQQPSFPTGADFDAMRNAAALISRSGIVPEPFRGKPEDVMVAILTARGLGLDPMVALQKGYVVKGKFDIEVSVKLGLVLSRVPDFDYSIDVLDDDRAVVTGGRSGKNQVTAEFTYAQAARAGLTQSKYGDKETWKFYRRDMMLNRALGRVLKLTCAAALYNMPVALDEPDEVAAQPNGQEPAAERSEAVVVDGGAVAEADHRDIPRAPVVPTPPHQFPDGTSGAHILPVNHGSPSAGHTRLQDAPIVDWASRMLGAIQRHYMLPPVPENKSARTKWAKSNLDNVLRIVNLYYGEKNLDSITTLVAMPPMDYEAVALWLEAREKNRVGAGGEIVSPDGKDAVPAQDEPAGEESAIPVAEAGVMAPEPPAASEAVLLPDDWEPAPEHEPEVEAASGWQALAAKGEGHVLSVLLAMRHETKNERDFVMKSPRGNYAVTDGIILRELGSVNGAGAPVAIWLSEWAKDPAKWTMLCRAVYEQASALKVRYL